MYRSALLAFGLLAVFAAAATPVQAQVRFVGFEWTQAPLVELPEDVLGEPQSFGLSCQLRPGNVVECGQVDAVRYPAMAAVAEDLDGSVLAGPDRGGSGPQSAIGFHILITPAREVEISRTQPVLVMAGPRWLRRPSPQYPSEAHGSTGSAEVRCIVQQTGRLHACEVVAETPPGMGFGREAVLAASQAALQPSGYAPDATVRFTIRFEQ